MEGILMNDVTKKEDNQDGGHANKIEDMIVKEN